MTGEGHQWIFVHHASSAERPKKYGYSETRMEVGQLEFRGEAAEVVHRTCASLAKEKTAARKRQSREMHHTVHPVHRPLARVEEQVAVAVQRGQVAT